MDNISDTINVINTINENKSGELNIDPSKKFRKYRKIYRIKTKYSPENKKCLTKEEIKELLDGTVYIEEKMDGGTCGISKNGYNPHIQGRRRVVPLGENSKPFYGIHSWAARNYVKIMMIPDNWIVYGEWLRAEHRIFYDSLTDFFIAFDVYDGKEYLNYEENTLFLKEIGLAQAPLVCIKKDITVEDVLWLIENPRYNESRLSSTEIFEGVIIKNYDKGLVGKCIKREFDDALDKHWLETPVIENRLKSFKSKI